MSRRLPGRPFGLEREAGALAALGHDPATITRERIQQLREASELESSSFRAEDVGLIRRDVTIPGYRGDKIVISIIARPDHIGLGPGIYHTHGGGMIAGNRNTGLAAVAPWVFDYDAVMVTVEYRLAPEFPDPYPVEDAYAGLVWMAEHAIELGIDPGQILVAGATTGGGLAAGIALLARDRGGPTLIGQMLLRPAIDDRYDTVSSKQLVGAGAWDRLTHVVGWTALLGERRGTDRVSIYTAPARASDPSGLPPTYIECDSAGLFRDEGVAYATALWSANVQAALHVWSGESHGSSDRSSHAAIAQAAAESRRAWIGRLLGES